MGFKFNFTEMNFDLQYLLNLDDAFIGNNFLFKRTIGQSQFDGSNLDDSGVNYRIGTNIPVANKIQT